MATTVEMGIGETGRHALDLTGSERNYDELLALVGRKRFVLLGEATHGTHEFYRERARITKASDRRQGFSAVAVEADWPDAYRVNRYVTRSVQRCRRGDRSVRLSPLSRMDVAQQRCRSFRRVAPRLQRRLRISPNEGSLLWSSTISG